jgi:SSS family solute:Na+ symporter
LTTNAPIVIGIILAFFIINAIVIRRFHIPQESIEQYAVGGRKLGWILVCFSYIGAWYVGAIYTGWVATAADMGIFALYLGIYSIGGMIVMYFMATNVWIWGKVYQLSSITDFIRLRYQNSGFSKFFAVVVVAVNFFWLIVEMITIGYCFQVATNSVVSFELGLILASAFVVIYSFLGGARATAIGNLVQGITFGVVGTITFYIVIRLTYGGIMPLFEMVEANKPELLTVSGGNEGLWMSSILTGIFGAYCWPQIFNRMFMTSGPRDSKKSVFVAPFIVVLVTCGILWSPLGGTLLPGYPADHQQGLFWIANTYGGPVILAFIAIFAISASMSTISAVSHSCGVMLGTEFLARKSQSPERRLKNLKASTLTIGVVAIIIATLNFPQLNFVALAMYEFIIQAFVPLFFGIMWKRGNIHGAFFGMLAGVVVALLGFFFGSELFSWAGGFSAGCVGLFVNFVIYWVCAMTLGKQKHADELWSSLELYDEEGNYVGDTPEEVDGKNLVMINK